MTYALLWMVLAAPAPVQEKIVPPQGPPPTWGTAVMKDGVLEITQGVAVPVMRKERRTRPVTVSGRVVNVVEEVVVTHHRLVQRIMKLPKVRYYDTAGKEIAAARAAKLLSRPTVVLMSADGKPLDPYYLRTVKEGTLIVVRPMVAAPVGPIGPGPAPQPK
jgi:uncharacterized membrane protein